MANVFDKFDAPAGKAGEAANPFDQFDGDDVETDAVALADQLEKLDPSGESGIGQLFGNSIMLGLKDKVSGVAGGVGGMIRGEGFTRGYQVAQRAQEIMEERARERTGWLGTAAEIAGTIGTGIFASAPAAASFGGRLLQSAREAGTLATIQGAGDSEGDSVGDVAVDAALSGVMGAGIGSSLTGLAEGGRAVLKAAGAAYRGARSSMDDEGARAALKVYDNLAADGVTPQQAAARMAKRDTALVNVADENTLGLARAASAKPGEGRTIMNRALDGQQKASQKKVLAAVNDALGGADVPFNKRVADMVTTRGNLGRQQYEKAFEANFANGHPMVLDDILKRMPGEAVRNAQRIAQAEGRPFGEQLIASIDDAGSVTFKRAPSLRELHYIQRGLRSATDAAYRQGVGEVGTAYRALHKELLGAMDEASPLYAKARSSYSAQSDMIDAIQRGREILSPSTTKNVDALAGELATMSKAEREMVRLGLARQMQDMLEATPDKAGDMVKRVFGTQAKRSAIRAAFDSDSAFRAFEAKMGNLAKEAKSFGYVRTGSRTSIVDAEKASAGALAEAAGTAAEAVTAGPGATLIRGALRILKGMGGMDEGVAREVAKLLVEQDPAVVRKALTTPATKAAGQAARAALLQKAAPFSRLVRTGSAAEAGPAAAQQLAQ